MLNIMDSSVLKITCLMIDIPRKFFKVNVYIVPKNLFKAHKLKPDVEHYAVRCDCLDAFFNSYPDSFEFGDYKFYFRVLGAFFTNSDESYYCLI